MVLPGSHLHPITIDDDDDDVDYALIKSDDSVIVISDDDAPAISFAPSRKALGKRPARNAYMKEIPANLLPNASLFDTNYSSSHGVLRTHAQSRLDTTVVLLEDDDGDVPLPLSGLEHTGACLPAKNKGKARDLSPAVISLVDPDEAADIGNTPALPSTLEKDDAELDEDAIYARKLMEEEEAAYIQACLERDKKKVERDAKLAALLSKQEETEYANVLKEVESKEEGIVFSVVVNVADHTLEDGSPAHPDDIERFAQWKETVEKTMTGFKITKFHWFVNHELERRFNAARDKLAELGRSTNEVQLFHGSASPNIDSILKGGFRIGGVKGHLQSHGAACGMGIYLAESAMMSTGYAVGSNRIFACRVLPGNTTPTPMHNPPSDELGGEPFDAYCSGGVYVVRHACLVLPCYMIEYENPYAVRNWGAAMLPLPVIPPIAPIRMLPNPLIPNLGAPFPALPNPALPGAAAWNLGRQAAAPPAFPGTMPFIPYQPLLAGQAPLGQPRPGSARVTRARNAKANAPPDGMVDGVKGRGKRKAAASGPRAGPSKRVRRNAGGDDG